MPARSQGLFLSSGEGVVMKIAISATSGDLNANVDPRFGRCSCFLIVDTDDLSFRAMKNSNASLGGGSGIQSAQRVAGQGVRKVLTGYCGPNAHRTLSAAGIGIIEGCSGPVREVISRFKTGRLEQIPGANVTGRLSAAGFPPGSTRAADAAGAFSRGRGSGRGMGGGQGRGRRRAMMTGRGPYYVPSAASNNLKSTEEVTALRQQAERLSRQLRKIQQPMSGIKKGREIAASIDKESCTGCGVCVEVCPMGAIHITHGKAQVNRDVCTGCGACIAECPMDAIRLT